MAISRIGVLLVMLSNHSTRFPSQLAQEIAQLLWLDYVHRKIQVERTNAWISRQRRLARDYERLAVSSESFIYIAMIRLGLRRLSHF